MVHKGVKDRRIGTRYREGQSEGGRQQGIEGDRPKEGEEREGRDKEREERGRKKCREKERDKEGGSYKVVINSGEDARQRIIYYTIKVKGYREHCG